ncbi:large conductance mechanosensitive channel protein MscL [Lederbergia lenta]|uniref:Large-conductance mechanosensitive channel n=1 Tax=Lederbergia lenta TaxID=1467 RepID=A0A2X4W6D1_LEDLE|nr:large conductance mechanosensitive channel protein MscL [Lederbergia lenta]MCM3112343.1 large conductance mechanosensitive channel protein MscL [Lederbergia lenta]MEC2326563.1 large conductance mechanosensitive channel protein MscL [Lederbergia lenta]SQI53170.1 large-conductance mechanosensitive channel [Lederbergia lenta]
MWAEFKKFAIQGNVLDLAVAVVIGAAFGKIVTSLVDNIIMPLVGVLLGGKSFEKLTYPVGDTAIEYGVFIQSIVDFFIIAISIFLFIKILGGLKRKKEEEVVEEKTEVTPEVELLAEIRDLLKK